MHARDAVWLLLLSLSLVSCNKDDKKSDSSDKSSKKSDDKKKSDDDDDSTKSKKKKKSGDDDDDSTGAKKKKKTGDDDDDSTADKPKKKKEGDDDDDSASLGKKPSAGSTTTLSCADSVSTIATGPKPKESFTATCPKGCTSGAVWGSGPYTTDSSICVAAVHAGAITKAGGDVDVSVGPGLGSYKGSTKNGVTTNNWGSFPKSFNVVSAGGGAATPSVDDTSAPLFAGLYSSNWGTTTFTQKGDKVNGSYPGGTLNCTVVKEVNLGCVWFESGDTGHAFLTRNRTSGVISGSWGSGASSSDGGSWTFTPIGKK